MDYPYNNFAEKLKNTYEVRLNLNLETLSYRK